MKAIKLYINDEHQKDWDEYAVPLELALNNSYNYELKNSSFYLVHGWDARTQLDSMIPPMDTSIITQEERVATFWRSKIIKQHQEAMRFAYDTHIRMKQLRADAHNEHVLDKTNHRTRTTYDEGEPVWVFFNLVKPGMTKKLAHLWHGPYHILEKVNEFAYKLNLGDAKARFYPIVHISRLKLFVSQTQRPIIDLAENAGELVDFDEELLPSDSWEQIEDNEYEVEEILDDQLIRKAKTGRPIKQYKIKWKDYAETTWVDEEDLFCHALLEAYDQKKAEQIRMRAVQTADEPSE